MTEMDELVSEVKEGLETVLLCPFKRYYYDGVVVPPKCISCNGTAIYLIDGVETECTQHPLYEKIRKNQVP